MTPLGTVDFVALANAFKTVSRNNAAAGLGVLMPQGITATQPKLSEAQRDHAIGVIGTSLTLIVAQVAAGHYVGKKMGRPTSGAIVGGLFGPLGLGVLSFWRKK